MSVEGVVPAGERRTGVEGAGRSRWVAFGVVAAAVLALDLTTKRLVQNAFERGEGAPIVGAFRLEHHVNDGVAFGLLSGRQSLILPAVAVALAAIVAYVVLDPRPVAGFAGGLMAGGALGNLVERLAYGHVTDFLHLPFWPTFNLADSFIVIGVALVALTLLLDFRGPATRGPETGS